MRVVRKENVMQNGAWQDEYVLMARMENATCAYFRQDDISTVPAPAPVKSELDECLALADLGASINLMPLSVFEKLNLQRLTKTSGSDFILEEIEAELSDTSYKSGIDDVECDPEKDILLLEAILNSEPLSPLPNHANYFPGVRKELKICEAKTDRTQLMKPS
ncbi:hypothetical protein Tco_0388602 [Tanacetum coccineum]